MTLRPVHDRAPGRSAGAKLGLAFAVVLGSAILLFGGIVHLSTVDFMERQTDALIEAEIEGLAEVYARDGLRGLLATIETRIARDPGRSSIYLVADATRRPVVGNVSAWPADGPNDAGWIEFTLTEQTTGRDVLARARPFLLRGGVNLLVGRDIRSLVDTEQVIRRALFWGMIIAMAAGLALGWFVSTRLTRRLGAITATSRAVMRGDLAQRIPVHGSGDDLDEVAQSLNAMLDEIGRLMSGIEQVSNNIAHDLRTPLTRLRNRLEQLSAAAAADDALSESIGECTAEVDRLLATFAALLRIARLEAAGRGAEFVALDLARVVMDAVELYAPFAEERGIELRTELQPVTVSGERELLSQAICNLIDNAIKFSPRGTQVRVSLHDTGSHVQLSVADAGAGIAADDKERVFERFYRGDNARRADGSGLGLSLVRAICRHHGAEVRARDGNPGTVFDLLFPLPADRPAR